MTMRTLVPLVVVGIGAFLFGALMPEDTSPAEAFIGLFTYGADAKLLPEVEYKFGKL